MHQRKARHEIAVHPARDVLEGGRDHAALVCGLKSTRLEGMAPPSIPVSVPLTVRYHRCAGHYGLLTPAGRGE